MSNAAITSQIETLASNLKIYKDSPLTLTTPYIVPIYDEVHDRVANGRGYHLDMWRYLFDILIHPKFPNVLLWRGDTHQSHEIAPGQRALRLKTERTGREGQKCCWAIQEYDGGSSVVKEYRLRNTYGDGTQEAEEIIKGVPTWKMQVLLHQETPLDQPERVPFEDAVVFDMFLDLVTDNFEPHTKTIEDGPGLQLEILQLLEKAQRETVDAADIASGKRRLSMQERLDGKRRKKD